jgi:V/A-type H+-transporting ATPase subunit E
MSLESILEHITSEAKAQRDKIIREAGLGADKIIQEAKLAAEKVYQELLDKEKNASLAKKQGLIVNARLEQRKNLLKAKQELIEEVFKKLNPIIKSDKFKKQQVLIDKVKEVAQDLDFYLEQLRQDYETEIARILFR